MLTSPVRSLLGDIRANWARTSSPTLDILGASALVLQQRHHRTTRDADVLRTTSLDGADEAHLLELAGPGRRLAVRHGIYVEILGNGVPFLPHEPDWRSLAFDDGHRAPSVRVLGAVDVAVSKLNRFHANDRSDIDHLIQSELVVHADFVRRFLDAVDVRSFDARADELPAIVRRFHTVERDMFGCPPTDVELPGWL